MSQKGSSHASPAHQCHVNSALPERHTAYMRHNGFSASPGNPVLSDPEGNVVFPILTLGVFSADPFSNTVFKDFFACHELMGMAGEYVLILQPQITDSDPYEVHLRRLSFLR